MADRDRSEQVLDAAHEVASGVLAPAAAEVDTATSVPRSHLAALAEAGLFGLAGPDGVDPETTRRVARTLAAACGVTSFVWAQHAGTTAHLVATPNDGLRDRWLARCASGEVLAGTAFAHLRRPGPPSLRAERTDRGWYLDGFAPWATSWGLAEVYSVAAATADDEIAWFALEGREAPGLRASPPLDLSVMGASLTVELTFDGFEVGDGAVLSVRPFDEWRPPDRRKAARVNPGVLGVVDASLDLLASREDVEAATTLAALRDALEAWEEHDAHLVVSNTAPEPHAEHRAVALDLADRATTAALAAVGGNGVLRSHPAQRLRREQAFYVVQAQSADGRAATLRRTRRPAPAATFADVD
ncbi:MAG: acyl-CoA dehydrogenase family protein [Actinomycetota bacterium]